MADSWRNLEMAGRAMGPEERRAAVAELMADPRFAGVVGLSLEMRDEFVEAMGRQDLAAHHGCLEHCAGSIHAMGAVIAELQQCLQVAEDWHRERVRQSREPEEALDRD